MDSMRHVRGPLLVVAESLLLLAVGPWLQGCDLTVPTTTGAPSASQPAVYGSSMSSSGGGWEDDGGGWEEPGRRRRSTPAPQPPSKGGHSRGGYMDCGNGVPLCGVFTLETGLSTGTYHHSEAVVHGLWPQEGQYGSSKCLKADDTRSPKELYPCYDQEGSSRGQLLGFEGHEWKKHGVCAGTDDAAEFFHQVCSIVKAPIAVMNRQLKGGVKDLGAISKELQRKGYWIWHESHAHNELQFSACGTKDGKWTLSAPSDFEKNCGPNAGMAPAPTPQPPTQSAWGPTPTPPTQSAWGPTPTPPSSVPGAQAEGEAQCVMGKKGPPCRTDGECLAMGGCVRCAKSHHCTAQTSRSIDLFGPKVNTEEGEPEFEEKDHEESAAAKNKIAWLVGGITGVLAAAGAAFHFLGSKEKTKPKTKKTRNFVLSAPSEAPALPSPAPATAQPMLQHVAHAAPIFTHPGVPTTAAPVASYHVPTYHVAAPTYHMAPQAVLSRPA